MPTIGLGTWKMTGDVCKYAVLFALSCGYRHIDTGWFYENQREIGEAIKKSGIPRDEIWITSKVWYENLSYSDATTQIDEILDQLQTSYVDLLLIHWPNKNIPLTETYEAFAEAKLAGKVKHIGVSNFSICHLQEALDVFKEPIYCNQVEYQVYLQQTELLVFCQKHNIRLTGYCPLTKGNIAHDETILAITQKYQKTPAQVVLRFLLDEGITVVPKSKDEKRIKENIQLDFILKTEDVHILRSLHKNKRLIKPDFHEF